MLGHRQRRRPSIKPTLSPRLISAERPADPHRASVSSNGVIHHQKGDIDPMVGKWWASVEDGGPALTQQLVSMLCLQ